VKIVLLFLTVIALFSVSVSQETQPAQAARPLHLMPWPSELKAADGQMVVDPSFSVSLHGSDPRLKKTAEIFLDDLRRHTGMLPLDFSVNDHPEQGHPALSITSDHANKEILELGEDESYNLEVTPSGATLTAPTTLGVMRGLQTFLQLVEITPQGFAAPAVTIHDKPRFPWRGLMIDCGRHFMPLDVLKRNLDGMAAVKLNVFHWHLSENQGFRVESKKYPKLHEMGSDGLYYTQEQVRDLIAYARDRGIRVVPEFDMPGHSTAWFVGYPDLASGPGPYSIERHWGVFDPAMDPTRESTYKFLDGFIGEMAKLFPDQFFHIGGDEVNGKQWDANPKIQEFMRAHSLKNNADLQAYFNTRIQKIVDKHGKTMEGWDEILRPDLPKTIVIQSWRGQESLGQAAQQGYRGLLSHGYYLDLMQSAEQHYTTDPFGDGAANLSDADKQKILGGEACMWSEYVSPETIDSRIWPRLAAIAERLWSPQNVTDVNSMYARMDVISHWLDAYKLEHNTNYDVMLRRIAGSDHIGPLRGLTDVVEPVKNYSRERNGPTEPSSLMPLNRVIDAARPESIPARNFSKLVNDFVSGAIKPGTEAHIRSMLSHWRDNSEELGRLAPDSSLVQEVVPVSQNLSALGAAGLQALDYLDRGEKAPDAWKEQQLAVVQQSFQPKGQVLLMVAGSVQKLIQFSAGERPTELALPRNAQ
jgi:hexosaminidase